MAFVITGYGRVDRPHRDVDRCLRDLANAVQARDIALVRGQACLFVEKLGEHFADEEALMRATAWSQIARHVECHAHLLVEARRFERHVAVNALTPGIATWALIRLPELIRFHCMVSDVGFAKYALRLAQDPRIGQARRPANAPPSPRMGR
jgi:hemerythrin